MGSVSRTTTVHFEKLAEKGARPLGPLRWKTVDTGFLFKSGATGEDRYHIVIYEDVFYECLKTHNKTSTNYPGSTEGETLWGRLSDYECVATAILMAKYALVENLGVQALEMYDDATGAVLCQIKDGNVTCNTGTFQNVTVNGNVKAQCVDLMKNGSVFMNSDLTLPMLEDGYSREITFIVYRFGGVVIGRTLSVESDNVKIANAMNFSSETWITSMTLSLGIYKLYGFRYGPYTIWVVTQLEQKTVTQSITSES